jgi:hypothetical protein
MRILGERGGVSPMVLTLMGAMMSRNALASGLSLVLVSEPDTSAFRLIKVSAIGLMPPPA